MRRFDGKTVLVTGGGSGIGAATVRRLAQEGANVAVVDLDKAAAQATIDAFGGGGLIALGADVADAAEVGQAFSDARVRFGKVDHLVNAAGIRGVGNALDTTDAGWRRNMSVNLDGSFNCCRAYAQAAEEGGHGGAIVNISSQAGLEGLPNRLPYVTSKHGVIGLTRAVAMDLARKGIRVNAVAPGIVNSPFTQTLFADPAIAARMRAAHPIGREGQPEEIAAVIAFLLSEDASFMTGAIVPVDGGITAGAASF
ncbi:SDR family NAD(P)-dependent oxidoreductase [Ruixingdingia sedimenti]|uniref:SDR family oxidoreductase n=1 Tax=Ruixingdingia sedimenti TaxID=3073604 RepID=A0ABU1FEX3_9RHOB|nr:SDR family oxidoreductase [Xinfangfangia sp. LG-4]MDR5655459.1 SDR family oxidoreductase [Xinfangfangia sp. LG-4]